MNPLLAKSLPICRPPKFQASCSGSESHETHLELHKSGTYERDVIAVPVSSSKMATARSSTLATF